MRKPAEPILQTSRTQMLLKDNQNKSKTKNIMLHRDASNIMCQPKYMTTLNRNTMLSNIQIQKQNAKRKGKLPPAALTTHSVPIATLAPKLNNTS